MICSFRNLKPQRSDNKLQTMLEEINMIHYCQGLQGCKFDFFTCLLVMIKTNTTRK